MKYMLIMRNDAAAAEAFKDMDFEAVINAMGAYNESMIEAGVLVAGEGLTDAKEGVVVDFSTQPARRAPLGPGSKLEVRRVTDESDFADFADNEYIQKEKGWREEEAARAAQLARES